MKLEDFTKDELISVIRDNMFFDEKRDIAHALFRRRNRFFEQYKEEMHMSQQSLSEYIEFVQQHDTLDQITLEELEKVDVVWAAHKKHEKKARERWKQYENCTTEIERLLSGGVRK